VFEAITYRGVPDVRIIVFLGVPVMAMVRLPTRLSGGKANLHQGAIAAGIDMASGTTMTAVWRTSIVSEHPDTGNPVAGVRVRGKGPLILELNARPGLAIQIANRAGLKPRLDAVERHHRALKTVAERVVFAKERFGAGPA
jgi:glutathione synthase/RimK-type ligase-like ATP-grasp enzyme